MLAAGTRHVVLLTLHEWKSDVMLRVGLDYDLAIAVLGSDGSILAETRVSGQKEVLGAAPVIPSDAAPIVGNAFKAKLEQLFADPVVVRALSHDQ